MSRKSRLKTPDDVYAGPMAGALQKDLGVGLLAPFPFIGLVAMMTGRKADERKRVDPNDPADVNFEAQRSDDPLSDKFEDFHKLQEKRKELEAEKDSTKKRALEAEIVALQAEQTAVVDAAYSLSYYAKLAFAFLPASFVLLEKVERQSCWHARVLATQGLAVLTTGLAAVKGTYDFSIGGWAAYHAAKGAMYFAVLDWGCRALRRKLD